MSIDQWLPTNIVSDHEWLEFASLQPDILLDLDTAFPGGGNLLLDGRKVVAVVGDGTAARDAFLSALADMAAGFADVESAEKHMRERIEVWMVQTMLSWTDMVGGWFKAQFSARARAEHRRRMTQRQDDDVSLAMEGDLFRDAHAVADIRVQEAAIRASAWVAQAVAAMRLAGIAPSVPLAVAMRTYEVAVARRSHMRHVITARAAGRIHRVKFDAALLPVPDRHPVLAWPAELGASALPRHVDDPIAMAASARADGLDWNGGNECLLDLNECQVRMPLSQGGIELLRANFKYFRGFQPVRGREDMITLAYPQISGVEVLRVTRRPLLRAPDGYSLSARLRYKIVAQTSVRAAAVALALAAR